MLKRINLKKFRFFLFLVNNPYQIKINSYYNLGDEKVNSYNDYYGYMNYMTGNNDMPNYGMANVGMNYQDFSNFDNNNFSNNFMMPTANNELLEPKEALEKGNMFKNLYVPYKNYKPVKLEAKTERQRKLNEIRSYAFVMKELNL